MKFNVGDRVSSKFTGYPMTGTVMSYTYGLEYFHRMNKPLETYYTWNKVDDQWVTKTVYIVKFDHPFRTLTQEEFWLSDSIPEHVKELAVDDKSKNIIYQIYSPTQVMAVYIEEDLELIEELYDVVNSGDINE